MEKLKKLIVGLTIITLLVAGLVYLNNQYNIVPQANVGSVTTGQEYNATSTPDSYQWTDGIIKNGSGSLGSVIITKSGDTSFRLLDATTTILANRPAGRQNTSTVEIAVFPASPTVGTYTFDLTLYDGLYLDIISGNTGTTTITYR